MTDTTLVPVEPVRVELGWAWLAGFVDGEGSIGLYRETDRRRQTVGYRAALQINNTHRSALERALSVMGLDHYAITELAPQTERHAAQYHIGVRERVALSRILPKLFPYLTIKRAQTAIVLDYVQRRLAIRGHGRYAPYARSDHRTHAALAELNRRGARAYNPW